MKTTSKKIIAIFAVLLIAFLLWGTTPHYNYPFFSNEKPLIYFSFENSNAVKLYFYLLGERHSETIDRSNIETNKLRLNFKDGMIYKSEDEKICYQAVIAPDYIFFPDSTLNEKEIRKIKKGQRDCRLSLVTNHIIQVTMGENNKVKKMYGFALSWDEFKTLNPQASPLNPIFFEDGKKTVFLPSENCKYKIITTFASEKSRIKKEEEKKPDDNPRVRFEANPNYAMFQRLRNGDYLKTPLSIPGDCGEPVKIRWSDATIIEKTKK